ncbi:MAG TPA: hypothetical protein VMZ26_07470 [Pyrinomonadaceae bacterium]|nr:hypothetical protein [Pyrinomonadaceae bacterium]
MPDEQLRALMQQLYDEHRTLRQEFDKWWRKGGTRSPEPEPVKAARNRFWYALDRLYKERLDSIWNGFAGGEANSIDEVIDFLEIDIPAHRCGYVKEKLLRKLKSVELTESQRTRLKQAALDLVSKGKFRRELRDWARLMIRLADEEFVKGLEDVIQSLDTGAARGAERMLRTVLENRHDFQQERRA